MLNPKEKTTFEDSLEYASRKTRITTLQNDDLKYPKHVIREKSELYQQHPYGMIKETTPFTCTYNSVYLQLQLIPTTKGGLKARTNTSTQKTNTYMYWVLSEQDPKNIKNATK